MIKKLFIFMKKLIVAILLIYAFNKMAVSLDLFIPMNFFTIFLVLLGGIPSIVMLAIFSIVFI